MKKTFEVRKLIATLMVAAIAIFTFAGCTNSRNEVKEDTTSSAKIESSVEISKEEESKIESSIEESVEEPSETVSKAESSLTESSTEISEQTSSLTEEEIKEIDKLIPEISYEELKAADELHESDIVCLGRALVDGFDNDTYREGDILRVFGQNGGFYLIYVNSTLYSEIRNDMIELLPLDYEVKETDTVYSE